MGDTSLLILAAGLGSRFGGDKQLVAVGPNGEAFLDYAIRDGLEAGVERIVVVSRTGLEAPLRAHLAVQHPGGLPLLIAHQDTFGPSRRRPWGTGHAVLSAAEHLDGPAIILNADDYYGPSGVRRTIETLATSEGPRGVLLAFELGRTLPKSGQVSRGVCQVTDGRLVRLVETHGIRREGGSLLAEDPPGILDERAPVSMNLWGLPTHAVERLASQWAVFHSDHADDPSAEFLLPMALDEQLSEALLEIDVLVTDEDWIGMTNPTDLDAVRVALAGR